jgi:hypothetical protein
VVQTSSETTSEGQPLTSVKKMIPLPSLCVCRLESVASSVGSILIAVAVVASRKLTLALA